MRVLAPRRAAPTPRAARMLRWRGIVFDSFDGRTWSSAAAPTAAPCARGPGGQFRLGRPRGPRPVVRQEVVPRSHRHRHRSSRRRVRSAWTCARALDRPGRHGHASRCRRRRRGCTTSSSPSSRRRRRPGTRVSAAAAALSEQERAPLPPASRAVPRGHAPGPRRHSGQPRPARGGPPPLAVPVHALQLQPVEAGDVGRSAPGVPLRPARGQLRVLLGRARRHAAEPRHSRARRRGLSARRVEPLRPVLHGPARRRARVGRGVLRRARLGDLRSVAAGAAGAAPGAVGVVAASSMPPACAGIATWSTGACRTSA